LAWRASLPDRTAQPWQAVLLGAALGAAATAVRLVFQGPLGRELPFIAFFPALIVAAAWGGIAGGLACLLTASVGAIVLLTPFGASPAWALGSFWVAGGLVLWVAAALADSVREQRESRGKLTETQAQLQTLVNELAHRNRNALFVIMAIVSQSARAANSAAEAERTINARLEALLRAQDVILQADGASAGLSRLLERALEPFDLARIAMAAGPEVQVESDVAVGLGLLFHELATNALKYGALSQPQGRVLIEWSLEAGRARLVWREIGGPPVSEPTKNGFGARLLETALVPQGGRAERRFEPEGLVCELLIPGPATIAAEPATPPGAVFASRILKPSGS
jgi:two-component sensor histidine kinase